MNDATNNPYSPPRAEVFDIAEPEERIDRPRHVFYAVALLWIALVLQAATLAFMWRLVLVASIQFVVICGILSVFWAITAWVVAMIERGRNWARFTYLALFVLGLPMVLVLLPLTFAVEPLLVLSTVLQLLLQLAGLVMVFIPPAGTWFRGAASDEEVA